MNWQISADSIDAERFVFLDETGLKTNLTRHRGWGFGGKRVVDAAPGGHWTTSTLISAISAHGVQAAMILDGPMHGDAFEAFCRYFLAPILEPGQIVVLDNLASHKSPAAKMWIEAAGATTVFLPPYSPDLNPIEMAYSKLKQIIRGCRPRIWNQIIDATRQALLAITPDNCQNYIEHCGYNFK